MTALLDLSLGECERVPIRSDHRFLPRALIVSDVRLYREGISALLAATRRANVIGAVSAIELEPYLKLAPDVILLDASLLRRKIALGTDALQKTIAFAVSEQEDDILACANSGLSAFVGRDGSAEDILAAITALSRGELVCPSRIAKLIFERLTAITRSRSVAPNSIGLTEREREIMRVLQTGSSNKEIARQLGIGVSTVKNHVHSIFEKLQVHRRGEAIAAITGSLSRDVLDQKRPTDL
jgi:two-component system nitrate/nitrite response regulator NarL